MADFTAAIGYVLVNEGGYVDNPHDSGGSTNCGISLRFLREIPIERLRKYGIFVTPDLLNSEHVKALTQDQILWIYRGEFWEQMPFEMIVDQQVCNYIFDCCILHGIHQGIKLVQRAIWASYVQINYVIDDGILGHNTLFAINHLGEFLLFSLRSERAGYVRLIAHERTKDKEFLDGWLERCYRR